MSSISNDINSAIVSGQLGLQNSFDGITQASRNIAQLSSTNEVTQLNTSDVLKSAAVQNLSITSQVLPNSVNDPIGDLLSLQLYSRNAEASARVLDVANETVGTILDTLA